MKLERLRTLKRSLAVSGNKNCLRLANQPAILRRGFCFSPACKSTVNLKFVAVAALMLQILVNNVNISR